MQIEITRLTLRPFIESDADAICLRGAESTKAYWLDDWIKTPEQALDLIGWFRRCWAQPDPTKTPVVWAIVEKASGKLIGHCGFGPKEDLGGMVELAYAVSSACAGQGYATEAAKAALWWAFAEARLPYVSALVHPGNAASRRVLDKLGFLPAGTRRMEFHGAMADYDCLRLHNLDTPTDPEWRGSRPAEDMAGFFDRRADGYDAHMREDPGHNDFYRAASEPIARTDEPIRVLDLGCGTGLELRWLFQSAPNARVTCVDLSAGMLERLMQENAAHTAQLERVQASYLDWQYPEETYDFVLSVNTMHHLWETQKTALYRNIHHSLRVGGRYIEADFMVDEVLMEQYRRRYWRMLAGKPQAEHGGYYHVDIPFTVLLQKQLLTAAGFSAVRSHLERIQPEWSGAVLVAEK